MVFCTVPSANTLVRWEDENAFAPIVRARPDPTFGRPVRHRVAPIDYGPVLLRMPFGFHLTMDTLPSPHRTMRGGRDLTGLSSTHPPYKGAAGLSPQERVDFPVMLRPGMRIPWPCQATAPA